MFEMLLADLKEKYLKKEATICKKVEELENKKAELQKSLESEFDRQVQAELAGKNYNENKIKNLNSELIEVAGRIEAYHRQQTNHSISTQDREDLLNAAAEDYKRIHIERLENSIKRYQMDKHIRKLMNEARNIPETRDDLIYYNLFNSSLFTGMDERAIRGEVSEIADICNDKKYKELNSKLKEYQDSWPSYMRKFVWNE